jgi:serine/threonine protein kinase
LIGIVLDKYEVLQKLGEGGMATVYRGRHTTLGRDVAIKVLHPHLSSTERNRLRFAREARAIEDMDHDNILKIFDYSGSDAQRCYIVTEFVDGLTLRELLTDHGQLPSEVATMLGMKLAEALSYAHRKKIIHRDLKPENVMLSREGELKLMDFGIAHFLDEMHLTMTGALVGSPAYMSPEQAMEREDLDHRSDLFSLGTLLFHIVSGQLPFSGTNPSIVLRNIIDGNRPHIMEVVPDISGRFADVIERLLQTDPDDRIFSATEVAALLHEALLDVDIDPTSPAWSLQLWLTSPDAYEARLSAHLSLALLASGKARLEARDHLEALGLFNRLLSINEDNDEVLCLIQSMHSLHPEDDDRAPLAARRWLAAALVVPVAVGLLTWVLWPPAPAPTVDLTPAPAPFSDPEILPIAIPVNTSEQTELETNPDIVPSIEARTLPSEPVGRPSPVRPPDRRPIQDEGGPEKPDVSPGGPDGVGPEVVEEAQSPGKLRVLVLHGWGNIYIDDELRGRTGEVGELEVTPGTHRLKVENPVSLTYTESFTVGAGELQELQIELQRKPSVVDLSGGIAGECEVSFDGVSAGTAAELGYALTNNEPEKAHTIELSCPDKQTVRCVVKRTVPGKAIRPDCP